MTAISIMQSSSNLNRFFSASDKPSTLVELLRDRGSNQPERLGYRFLLDGEQDEACLTYSELDRRARAVGAWLQSNGAAAERVLLLYPPGLNYVVAFLGCLYAGAVAVPVYPPRLNRSLQRLEAIVADAQATVALTTDQIASRAASSFRQSPVLSRLRWLITEDIPGDIESDWKAPAIDSNTLALLQYTSGSTGAPKGVMLTHENLLSNSDLLAQAFEYDSESHVVSWLPVYHDMGLIGGVLQPLNGGFPCTLMSPMAFLQKPVRWLQAITRHQATISGAPNFAYELCARKITAEQKSHLDLRSWTVAFNGAEPVRPETLARFAEAFKDCGFRPEAFFPCYGLAEATLIVSGDFKGRRPIVKTVGSKMLERDLVVDAEDGEMDRRQLVSSGRNLLDQQVAIVHPKTRLRCQPQEVGEIWVAGKSIAQGYWKRDEETQQVFQAHIADTGEGPFLRTGDLGFLSDGELFVTGRLKDLIIIRGLNHYPQDIEFTAERSHAALKSGGGAAFSVDLGGEEKLILVHEIELRQRPDVNEVIDKIRQAVTQEHEVLVDSLLLVRAGAMPKTSSGKIQRYACREGFVAGTLEVVAQWHALKASEGEIETGDEEIHDSDNQSGREAFEHWLISELAQKLGVSRPEIALEQPISSYGLDSLSAIELAHNLETKFGISLSMASFLDGHTIAELANEALGMLSNQSVLEVGLASSVDTLAETGLSRGQQALWFLHRLRPDSPAYNLATAIRIRSEVDLIALRRAFEIIVERHAALRTTFTMRNGRPVQQIHERSEFGFQYIEASDWTEAALNKTLVEEVHKPFDLEQGPLLRITLLQRAVGDYVLLLAVHHIVADFWSLSILLREMSLIYSEQKAAAPAALSPIKLQYSDYIRWQEQMLDSTEGERLWQFWEKQLAGELPVLNLATDRPRPPVQTYSGASTPFRLDAELTRKLKSLARTHGITLYTTLLSAFQVLLHRHTGQDDILIGSLTSGRSRADLGGLIGYFVNPVAQRADLSGNPTFAEFLKKNSRKVFETLKHQNYPFPLLVERLQPVRDPSRSPLFQVMFTLQKTQDSGDQASAAFALGEQGTRIKLGDLVLESMAVEQRIAQFDLALVMAEVDEEIGGSLQYNTDLFAASTINAIADHFVTLIEGAVSNPSERLSNLPILTPTERQQLLIENNDTQATYAQDACIHHLFERQAARTPHATAVVFAGAQLTYGELNRRANQLARRLQKLGVGPDVPVGICVERSLEMVIGLLGVLKAGGAYLPMDPFFPRDRLAFMLEDTGASVILTQRHLLKQLPAHQAKVVCLDTDWQDLAVASSKAPNSGVTSANLAYIIYTSGSTGKPKGVMIDHRNVVNFFCGMDSSVGCDGTDTLIAVTSISFDISVLELLWTLVNGSRILIVSEQATTGLPVQAKRAKQNRSMDFSLFYFATDDASQTHEQRYRLVLEGAKFADQHGFSAVWTPERHFHAFGGLYPNPSVMSAALAALTQHVQIRAGSVVMPLHNPIRVAEEWALVDNLSKGRVGIAFASGWHADDFVFFPENYTDRKDVMLRGIEDVRKLWRGDSVTVKGGSGNDTEVKIYPRPVQSELPIWLTAAGAPDTFVKAGEIGANVLTHLLGQSLEEVAQKIKLYRESLARNGYDPHSRRVTLMLHTFIGDSKQEVKQIVRQPFTNYLRSSIGLIASMIKSLNLPLDLNTMTAKDMDDLLEYAFNRYFETSALFGTAEDCVEQIERLKEMEVDEVACLIDFGVDVELVMGSFEKLELLKNLSNAPAAEVEVEEYSLPQQAARYGATIMQCTPSMMSMLHLNPEAMRALQPLRTLMLGGEALPPKLATQVKAALPAQLINMYGPTETTIWSATHKVETGGAVSVGRPIANTQIYILDHYGQPVPTGVAGELSIGGDGVARGYYNRADLCAERFIPDAFGSAPGARLYRTGDLARLSPDGTCEFLGRLDFQVKIRGHRIELQEIEARISQHPAVREVVVLAREDVPGDKRLVAYVIWSKAESADPQALRDYLKDRLPDYMIPAVLMTVESFPQTSNGKVDRKALPAPDGRRGVLKGDYAAPRSKLEQSIAAIWRQALKVDRVGLHDNFFDIGGHSLLMAQVHSQLREIFKRDMPLIKMFEHPTISSLALFLSREQSEQNTFKQSYDRALKQREGLKRQKQPARAKYKGQ